VVRVTDDELERYHAAAEARGLTLAELVRQLLEEALR
jgi:predicted DNA binding CopG/RHH family protein